MECCTFDVWYLGQATKLYILKSWSFKVASVFWFDAFLNMLSAIWWIYEKTERGKYFLSNGNFFLTSKWCQKSMNWKTMFKIAIRFKFYALCTYLSILPCVQDQHPNSWTLHSNTKWPIFVRISTDKQNIWIFGKFSYQLEEILKDSCDFWRFLEIFGLKVWNFST